MGNQTLKITKGRINLMGQRFGTWTVISIAPNRNRDKTMWHCRCDCGAEADIATKALRAGMAGKCRLCTDRKKRIKFAGESLTKAEWAKLLGMTVRGLHKRLQSMSIEDALTLPKQKGVNPGRLVTVGKVTLNVSEWARRLGISRQTVRNRERKGQLVLMSKEASREFLWR